MYLRYVKKGVAAWVRKVFKIKTQRKVEHIKHIELTTFINEDGSTFEAGYFV